LQMQTKPQATVRVIIIITSSHHHHHHIIIIVTSHHPHRQISLSVIIDGCRVPVISQPAWHRHNTIIKQVQIISKTNSRIVQNRVKT